MNNIQSSFSVENPTNQLEILAIFTFPYDTSKLPKEFGFQVFVGPNQHTVIGYNVQERVLFTDRTLSGSEDFNHNLLCVTNAHLIAENGVIQLRIFLDQNTVEVFANNRKFAMSNLIFPDSAQNKIYAYSFDGEVTLSALDTWVLNDFWPKSEALEGVSSMKEFLSK